ncbi:Uncharacterized membrane protein YfcA [Desulfobacula phenolica]|uniref:Probable membrane transporter protein n=2 Tax=Desulfobacula phenolica TaxID=90732 RepID=A0A1H2JFR9_9BACT|nr:Uncharacterized membrane protein YfcA [Desulfobacula phenolica]
MKKNKLLLYIMFAVVCGIWLISFSHFREDFLGQFYYMPFLGVIAATIANTTPAAAGIVYFPVLTRLQISPVTAVQFSLIIQAYGMGLGTFKWYLVNKRLFMANVMPLCLSGGVLGIIISIVFIPMKNPELLSLTFNTISFIVTQVIFFSILFRRTYPNFTINLNLLNMIVLFTFSLVGGLVSGWIGFGIDTMFYFLLTFIFKINPAIAIVTSISIMAAVSVAGTVLNIIFNQVPLSLWYSAVPGVTIAGLFFASYFAVKIGARNILILFAFLLSVDFFMAFWTQQTIPMNQTFKLIFTYILVLYLLVIHVKIFKQSYKKINPEIGKFKSDQG